MKLMLGKKMNELYRIEFEISGLKSKLTKMWHSKGEIDHEILALADQVDKLLSIYDRYLQETG